MKNNCIGSKSRVFLEGIRDGIPIGLGYFAVSFSLGILARKAGLNPFQGFIASLLNMASAGEKALFDCIESGAAWFEIAFITLIINARYLLMSCALSQKFDEKTPFIYRFILGFQITDELFGISIARKGKIQLAYNNGAYIVAGLLWSIGTSCGIVVGNILPVRIVSALSVALYGMFIAIIIPPAKKNVILLITVILSFLVSYAASVLPYIKNISIGTRTIILTVLISSIVAVIKPVKDDYETNERSLDNKAEEGEKDL